MEPLLTVRRFVLDALDEWERTHATGSARPTFMSAWKWACRLERYPGTPLEREQLWRAWLTTARPLTRARMREHLAATGPAAARVLREVGLVPPAREPGEDG